MAQLLSPAMLAAPLFLLQALAPAAAQAPAANAPLTPAAATCTWNGGSGSWNSAANWSNCNGTFPGTSGATTDDAVVSGSGVEATLSAGTINMGALTISNSSNAGGEVLLTGTGVGGTFGSIDVNPNGTFDVENGGFANITGDVTNAQNFWLGNAVKATVGGSFTNSGDINVAVCCSQGGSSLAIAGTLTNSNSVNVGGGGGTGADTLSAASFVNTNTFNINADGTMSAASINNNGGTINVNANGAMDISGAAGFGTAGELTGHVNLSGPAVLNFGSGGITEIGDGASNPGELVINGPTAFMESGGVSGNSALANLTTIASNGQLFLAYGASVTTSGSLTMMAGGDDVGVDQVGSGGSTLTIGGDLVNHTNSFSQLQIGNGGMTQAALVKVNGNFIDTGGATNLFGGSAAGATADMVVTGAAPSTFESELTVQGNTGGAALQYASGGNGITQIGDGASNGGDITLNGPNAYLELGATNSNSALANLATVASNGQLHLMDGASVTTNSSLTLDLDSDVFVDNGGAGGSTLTVNGDLIDNTTNFNQLQIGGGGMSQAALVKVNGNFSETDGALVIQGGNTAAATAELVATGAAPSTFSGYLSINGGTGAAALQYASGGNGITQIGDGANNSGNVILNGANAYLELGPTNSNSALANLATIASNGQLRLTNGASVTTSGSLTLDQGSDVFVDAGGSNGGSTLTVNGNLNDSTTNFNQLQIGGGNPLAALVKVNGNFSETDGALVITGGTTAAGTSELVATGASPSTFSGYLDITGGTGAAALQYASGGNGITQIGDGAKNSGNIILNGANAYVELGAANRNNALANLATIASNGQLNLQNGASVTTSGSLSLVANGADLNVDQSGGGGSTLTVDGNLINDSNNFSGMTVGGGGITKASLVTVTGEFENTGGATDIDGSSTAAGTLTAASGATNTGTVNVNAYGNLDVTGGNTYTQTAGGTVIAANGNLRAADVAVNGGSVQGDGTITGNLYNGAIVTGGISSQPGTLTIDGNFTNNGTGEQASPFGNTTAGTVVSNLNPGGSQQITVTGAVSLLGGTIQGDAVNGFNYAAGQTETVMNFAPGALTGVFAGVQNGNNAMTTGTSTNLGNGLTLGVEYNNQQGNIQLAVVSTPGTTTETWNGGTGNWSTGTGWSSAAAPQFYSNVTIGSTSTGTVTIGQGTTMQDATVESLAVNNGNTLAYQATTPTSLSVGNTVTVDAGGALSLPTSGDTLDLGGNFSNAGTATLGAGASLDALGTLTNTGSMSAGNGASVVADGGPTSVGATNSGTLSLAGATVTVPSLANSGTVSGNGSIKLTDTDLANTELVEASGGTLSVNGGGIQGSTGNITIASGATLNLAGATAGSTVATLSDSGALGLGSNNLTVSSDYDNANFGTGNSFNKNAGVTGTGQILAAGNVAQDVTGTDVTGGTTATPTLAFGNVHVGSTNSATYAIGNTGTSGPSLRGAIQTDVNGGNLTDVSLSGTGVTAANYGPITVGSQSSAYTVTYDPTVAGALTGQAVHLANNFANVGEQTLAITGAAYDYADPTVASSLHPAFNFGVVQAGQSYTDPLTITNTLVASNAAYQEGLNAAFGSSTNPQLTGAGSITNLAAGDSNSNAMVVTLKPVSAGAIGGTVTVDFASNGDGTSGLGITNLTPATGLNYTWSLSGTVVNEANPVIAPANPVSFGNVRIGSSQTQALSVTNQTTASPQASLDAQLSTTPTGAATSNGGTIHQLLAGDTDDTSMVVGLDTASAGAQSGSVGMALQSDSAPNGCASNCIVDLNPYTVNVSGTVYRLANPTLNTPTIDLAARVGGTASAAISVTNASPDPYTEGLAATLGTAPTGFSNNGSITNLAAQGTDNSSLQVALSTATAGRFTGNQTVDYLSNGLIDNATPESVGSGTVALTGSVYTPAVAKVNTASPVNFGIVHMGDGGGTLSQSVSVTNAAAQTALNDTLLGNITTSGASAFSGTGSLGTAGLAAQQTSTAMGVNLSTATAGIYSGNANLAFASHDSQLADLGLTGSSLGLQAQVNNYAKLAFLFGSGTGSLTGSGNDFVFDFGDIKQGHGNASAGLLFLNDNPVAQQAFTDLLSSSGTVSSGSGFDLSGDSVSDLAGGGTQSGFDIDFDTANLGSFNELLSFNVNSSNASGYDEDIGAVDLQLEGTVTGSVTPVPEPGELGLFGGGLAMLLVLLERRRRDIRRRDQRS